MMDSGSEQRSILDRESHRLPQLPVHLDLDSSGMHFHVPVRRNLELSIVVRCQIYKEL